MDIDVRHSSARRICLTVAALVLLPVALLPRWTSAQGIGLEDLREMMAWGRTSLIIFDKFEYAPLTDDRPLELDATGWYGGAYNRLWIRVEAEQPTTARRGEGEAHLYYGRLITPYFDALAGVRVDQRWGPESATRAHLAAGLTGLAPLTFELSPTLFVSHRGDVSARLEVEYQLLLMQRLIAEPEIELNAALQDVPKWGVGAGINDIRLGLRLRYEIIREFAPYIGIDWLRRVGGAADFARVEGERVRGAALVVGLRMWR